MPERPPIAPELLRYVDDYVRETNVDAAMEASDLDSESNLVAFYRELFSQLFANVLGEPITSFSAAGAQRARRLYLRKRLEVAVSASSRKYKAFIDSFFDPVTT